MLNRYIVVICFMLILTGSAAQAQCLSAAQPSCNVYPACFEKYCSCEATADGYFLRYGKRYCDRFLASEGWSEKGKKWRDATLLCLQERIVPKLDISENPKCDCKTMKAFAFAAHVDCYTQSSASVCSLEITDYAKLLQILDVSNDLLKDPFGRRQMREAFARCVTQKASGLTAGALDTIKKIIGRLE